MWHDNKVNCVYVSQDLRKRYPHVLRRMTRWLNCVDIDPRFLAGKNIWARDYMPIQVGDKYYRFRYKAYGTATTHYPQLKVSDECFENFTKLKTVNRSLDGGNCIRYGNKIIATAQIFKDNPKIDKKKLITEFENILEAKLVVIPIEPYDTLGHSDGIVKFIDDKYILVNNYAATKLKYYKEYQASLEAILKKENLNPIRLPYVYHKMAKITEAEFRSRYPAADDFNPAYGYYINFLHVKGLILVPTFEIKEDEEVLAMIEKMYPGNLVEPVNCSELSFEGGLLNCITATYNIGDTHGRAQALSIGR